MTETVPEYVYGIVDARAAAPSGPGIAGAPLRVIAGDGVAALVSALPQGNQLRLGRDELLTHSRVLSEALANGTVLPMRFGIVLDGSEEVHRHLLDRRADELREELGRFDGKVELSLRVVYQEEPLMRAVVRDNPEIARLGKSLRGRPDDATYFGRVQLGELVADGIARKQEQDAAAILAVLAPIASAVQVGEPAHERAVLSASFLVERDQLPAFDAALESLASEQSEQMRFKLTGPLPPHSFVEITGER